MLAAGGMSNKEIAAKLFVTVAIVEAHLSHACTKLAIRFRSQLAQRLAGEYAAAGRTADSPSVPHA